MLALIILSSIVLIVEIRFPGTLTGDLLGFSCHDCCHFFFGVFRNILAMNDVN